MIHYKSNLFRLFNLRLCKEKIMWKLEEDGFV
mgnify:CR=1 FL=1